MVRATGNTHWCCLTLPTKVLWLPIFLPRNTFACATARTEMFTALLRLCRPGISLHECTAAMKGNHCSDMPPRVTSQHPKEGARRRINTVWLCLCSSTKTLQARIIKEGYCRSRVRNGEENREPPAPRHRLCVLRDSPAVLPKAGAERLSSRHSPTSASQLAGTTDACDRAQHIPSLSLDGSCSLKCKCMFYQVLFHILSI